MYVAGMHNFTRAQHKNTDSTAFDLILSCIIVVYNT